MHPAKAETASTAIVPAIFNVSARAAWCPTHVCPSPFDAIQSIQQSALSIQPNIITAKNAKDAKKRKFRFHRDELASG
jgi:hypothetical protein